MNAACNDAVKKNFKKQKKRISRLLKRKKDTVVFSVSLNVINILVTSKFLLMNQANLLVTRMLIRFNDTKKTIVSFFLFNKRLILFFCFLKFFLTAALKVLSQIFSPTLYLFPF